MMLDNSPDFMPPASSAATGDPAALAAAAASTPFPNNKPAGRHGGGWWRNCVLPFATGLLLLVVFILPAVFVHLVTGGVDPSPVLEDMLLVIPLSLSTTTSTSGGGATPRCGICYDMMRTVEHTILTSKSTSGGSGGGDVGPLLFENKRQRNLFLSSVESSVCSSAEHFGNGGGGGAATITSATTVEKKKHTKQSVNAHHISAIMQGKHFRRTRGKVVSSSSGAAEENLSTDDAKQPSSASVAWNCSKFFRLHRDAIAEHIIGITAASINSASQQQHHRHQSVAAGNKKSPAAPSTTTTTSGQQHAHCPLLAPLIPSIAAHVAKRRSDLLEVEDSATAAQGSSAATSTVAPSSSPSCAIQQQFFAESGTGPVCSEYCESSMPWIDRTFIELLRFVARHREVQLLCVCIREMWGVVLLLGLASGVIVLLLQLKGVHWALQVSISEALALRKATPLSMQQAASQQQQQHHQAAALSGGAMTSSTGGQGKAKQQQPPSSRR